MLSRQKNERLTSEDVSRSAKKEEELGRYEDYRQGEPE
jgi:hypothetical protein